MPTTKRTSLNLDKALVTDVKMAVLQAEQLGLECPRNVSAFVNDALAKELRSLRERIDKAKKQAR